jgi:hypothetical protein
MKIQVKKENISHDSPHPVPNSNTDLITSDVKDESGTSEQPTLDILEQSKDDEDNCPPIPASTTQKNLSSSLTVDNVTIKNDILN